MKPWTKGPYTFEAFNEIIAGQPNYGGMIIGGDGETIVAQCVAEHNISLLLTAPETIDALELAIALLESTERETDWRSAPWFEESETVKLRAVLSRALGEQNRDEGEKG